MSEYTVEQVVAGYLQYRDAIAQMSERHKQEMQPYTDAKQKLEAWLQAKMQADGVDSYKTSAGTPYRAVKTSIKMDSVAELKNFVLEPAAQAILNALVAAGYPLTADVKEHFLMLMNQQALWELVDFRAGKKGIEEYIEAQRGELPPGVSISQFETVNVRSA